MPFIRASAEHGEPAGIDITRQMTAADQDLGVFDIPAYGYARYLVILVQATGGAGTGVTATEDAPFTSHKNIFLTEPNGAVLEQFDTAYGMFLANKWGGYKSPQGSDPRATPVFTGVGASTGNFTWLMRIPIELNSRDGLGSLPNQNAAAVFKLRLTLAGSGSVYSVLPTTLPNVRTRVFLEAWDQPEQSSGGQANQITPPAMNTTQFWSYQNFSVNAGANTLRLTRMGNYIRNLIFVFRRGGTSRANGNGDWPDPMTIFLDTRPLDIVELNNWRQRMYDRTGFGGSVGTITPANDTPNGLDNGVYVYDFMHEFDGELGRENRDLWLPTLGSTRFELQGTFANAGTLTVYTNDVAIAGNVFM
ncbi:MAG TPA: hypothetical protein VFI97_03580 [Arthrobacter sp.]|nr:hypothetical protein [Arthrobacter sp.]